MSLLKRYRRQLVVETMPALWVVKHLDVVERISTSIMPGVVDFPPDSLPFQQLEKVSATALSWQLLRRLMLPSQVIGFQDALPVTAAELATLSE